MGTKRCVEQLLSVFDLKICDALALSKGLSIPVMFTYNKKGKVKRFFILERGLSTEMKGRVTSWLEENIDVDDMTHISRSGELDADNLTRHHQQLYGGF